MSPQDSSLVLDHTGIFTEVHAESGLNSELVGLSFKGLEHLFRSRFFSGFSFEIKKNRILNLASSRFRHFVFDFMWFKENCIFPLKLEKKEILQLFCYTHLLADCIREKIHVVAENHEESSIQSLLPCPG